MRRIIGLIVAVLLAASVLAGCGGSSGETTGLSAVATETAGTTTTAVATAQPATSTAPTTAVSNTPTSASSTVIVTDAGGRTVELPSPVNGIVTAYGLDYVIALGLGDKILNGSPRSFQKKAVPALADRPSIVSSGNISVEAIAKMKPDVFIHKSGATDLYDALGSLGIPSIGIHMETVDEIVSTLDLLGTALGVKERAKELGDYFTSLMAKAQKLTADVTQSDRSTAILMGGSLGTVAHGDMFQSIMMETAGGINMARDIKAEGTWPVAGTEKIFDWDPDFIFIQNSIKGEYTIADLQNDKAWSQLQAVKNNRVYVVPSKLDSWEFPGIQSALGTLWMVSKMYPELYSEQDLETDVTQFYQEVYGMTLDRETLGY